MRGDYDGPVHNFFSHLTCFENNKDLRKQSFENNRALWSKAPTSRLLFGSEDELQEHRKIVQTQTYILWIFIVISDDWNYSDYVMQSYHFNDRNYNYHFNDWNYNYYFNEWNDNLATIWCCEMIKMIMTLILIMNTTKWQSWRWPWYW